MDDVIRNYNSVNCPSYPDISIRKRYKHFFNKKFCGIKKTAYFCTRILNEECWKRKCG